MNYKTILIFILALSLVSCSQNLVKSINHDFKNSFDKWSRVTSHHLNNRKLIREIYIEDFLKKHFIKNEKLFIIEKYNVVSHRVDIYIYADKLNIEKYYLLEGLLPINSIYEFTPAENYDVDSYRFFIKKAKEGNYDELSNGYINYPNSSADAVYLLIIDYKNEKEFKISKSIVFDWFTEY